MKRLQKNAMYACMKKSTVFLILSFTFFLSAEKLAKPNFKKEGESKPRWIYKVDRSAMKNH